MEILRVCLAVGFFLPCSLIAQCTDQWIQQISGLPTGVLSTSSPSLVIDMDGNVIVSNVVVGADTIFADGQTFPETNSFTPNSDFFITKYSNEGVLLWLKTIIGEQECGSFDIGTDGNGNIYVGGIMQNSINVDGTLITRPLESLPQPGYFILKFNPQGQLQWHHKGDWKSSRCYRLAWTGTDLAFVLPYSDSVSIGGAVFYSDDSSWHQDMVFGRLDSDGNLISAVNIGGEGSVEVNALACDADGCILQGRFGRELVYDGVTITTPAELHFELYQMSISPSYSLDWVNFSQSSTGIDPRVYGLGMSNNGQVYFSGLYRNSGFTLLGQQLPSPVQDDVFVGKLSRSDGSVTWLKNGGGSSLDATKCLATNGENIWTGGEFYSDVFDYEGSSLTNTTDGENDGFLVSLDSDGKPKCALQLEGDGQNGILQVENFEDGHLAVLGYFNGTVEFGGQTYVAQGNYDLLVIKTCLPCDTLTSITETTQQNPALQLYPNPASHSVRVEVRGSSYKLQSITFIDMLGHAVSLPFWEVGGADISISGLANGLYTVAATFENGETRRQRLVVQH